MMKITSFTIALFSLPLISVPSVLAQGRLDRPFFFQDGQQQVEQEIQRLQQQQTQQTDQSQTIEHPSQLLTINQGELQWQKFIFKNAGFSIWIPEGIQSQESEALNTTLGQIPFEVFATHPQSFRYIVAYSEVLNPTKINDPQAVLAAIQQGIVDKTNFKLVSSQAISFQQYPGKELSLNNAGETIAFRVYLINQRVYIFAVGQQANTNSEDMANFFNSFRLL